MDKIAVLFTMKGCPFCVELKEMLEKEQIPFVNRDIHEHEDEYELFVEVTGNEYVPAFMLIESPGQENSKTELYAPERDYDELDEGVKIIKEFYER